MADTRTSRLTELQQRLENIANSICCFTDSNNDDSTTLNDEQPRNASTKNNLPHSRASNAPRARFAMLNAFNTSNAQAAVNTPAAPKKQEKPAQEPVVRKTKLDMLAEKYRDRAGERRQRGADDEIENEEELDAEALRERRERSKYLGGSEETTHLVEGLDILLYERRKLEIELEAKRAKEAEARASEPQLVGAKQLVIDRHGRAKAVDAPQEFRTAIGKGVYNALFQREAPPPIESFLPDRMTYIFPINPTSAQELPTIMERNMLADTEALSERDIRSEPFSAATSENALNKLSVVMSYLSQGESGIRRRRQEIKAREEKAKAIVAETLQKFGAGKAGTNAMDIDEDDEDIFGDVAAKEYTPTQGSSGPKEAKSFEGTLWDKVRGADTDGRQKGDLSAKRTRDDAVTSKGGADADEEASDDYEGFESGSDEEDLFAMDNNVRLKRNDFATEEEYEKYELTREAIPKQAFMMGVKAGERRKALSSRSKKSKLRHDLYKTVSGSKGSAPQQ